MKKIFKTLTIFCLLTFVFFSSFVNCTGKFALTRIFYNAHQGIKIGSGMLGKIVSAILFWFPFVQLTLVGAVIDFVFVNLLEFWTDSNIVGFNEYNKDGIYVKSLKKDGEVIKLTYLNFGQKLMIDISKNNQSEKFIVLRSNPGKFYVENNGRLEEAVVSSKNVGSKMILKMATGGKLESSKVIDVKDYKHLEEKYTGEIY
ncbi:MAG: DUF3332 family protein [Leptospiraceae bacterium]|nr:DUF3332 family protein [Leptospiraceae bacterium]